MIRLPNLQAQLDAIDKRKKAAWIIDWLRRTGCPLVPGVFISQKWLDLAEAAYKTERSKHDHAQTKL